MNKIIKKILLKDKFAMFGNKSKFDLFKLFLTRHPSWLRWKYICYLRKSDYVKNRFLKLFYKIKKNKLGTELGIEISSGKNIGPGLVIYHNSIVINSDAVIGSNCHLHGFNCIGNNGKGKECPIIGNNVDIGFGAIVIGNVNVTNDVKIGANAVVVKDILNEGSTWVGVPSHKI